MLIKRRVVLSFLLVLLCFYLVGCQLQQRPQEQPQDKQEPTITLFINETGEKKEIKMEEYIKGVVAAEMDPNWPDEALAAQAILARTFTLERMKSMGGVPAHGTDASTSVEEFQAYNSQRINENVSKAVERTRGKVAEYQGNYIKAWFYADGGGKTAASAEEGLAYTKEPSPYVHSVEDPGASITTSENKKWRAVFPLSVVREKVKKVTGSDPGPITQATITKKGNSGRAMTVKLGKATVSGPAFRLALGSEKMRSTLLSEFKISGSNLVIGGKGFGHGVGMSQWGAKAMAEQGKKAEEIVKYFFKDIEINSAWK